eukprot:5934684-Lingulodinium_polyedra.AAC.1
MTPRRRPSSPPSRRCIRGASMTVILFSFCSERSTAGAWLGRYNGITILLGNVVPGRPLPRWQAKGEWRISTWPPLPM